uniref:RING-type E3 ubiquitin transferase n=1 Tax=Leersia perrieri TaxID=77586 RepID=A0A0D9V5T0_9ORYZ
MSGNVNDPGSAWFGSGERSSSSTGPSRNVRLIATAVAAFVSVLGLALFLHLYVCHVRRRNRRRAAAAAAALPTAASATTKVGLDPSAIAALPTAAYAKAAGDEEEEEEASGGGCSECAICLGAMQDGDTVRVLPACSHMVFHVACIDKWLASSSSCPVCRAGVEPPPPPPPTTTTTEVARCVLHEKQEGGEKEEAVAGSSAPVRVLGASLMKMLSRERPSGRRMQGVHAVEMEDLESQLPRPQQQQLQH